MIQNKAKMIQDLALSPALLILAKEVLSLCIPERATSDHINKDEHNDSNDEDYIGFPPFISQVSQKPSLTGVAVVA